MTQDPTVATSGPVSVLQGHVRIALADDWPHARKLLAEHADARWRYYGRSESGDQLHDEQVARAAMAPIENGLLFLTLPSGPFASTRYAEQGVHGLTVGDLAFVYDYPNGCLGWWTIAVKCRLLEIGPLWATVRITGDAEQFTRHGSYTIPLSAIRPRRHS
jgi:hypothetical protein